MRVERDDRNQRNPRNQGARAWRAARLYCVLGGIATCALACVTPPLESPPVDTSGVLPQSFPQNLRNKVDILFMVDNSNSMGAMQQELSSKFAAFFQPFIDLANAAKPTYADLHIGVVTSDYGAGATGAPGCSASPGGQQGKLQARGQKAPASCKNPVGANFIHYVFEKNGGSTVNNLPPQQSLVDSFGCMAAVGAGGCGFEHQLESVYAALHNNLIENKDFLRDDAILVVVFLTNEDDSSAPPDTDLFDKNKGNLYGYEGSYARQTRFGVMCGHPPMFPPDGDSGGDLQDCIPAPNLPTGAGPGKEYDVSRYIDFFTRPAAAGGVKASPRDVILVGIDAPEAPFQVILANPATVPGTPYVPCAPANESGNPACVPVLQHSCVNPAKPDFYGDPAVRLNAVIRSVSTYVPTSITPICADDYGPALVAAARQVVSSLGADCIRKPLPVDPVYSTCATSADCAPSELCALDPRSNASACLKTECQVQDSTDNPDGTTSVSDLPQCPENGANPGSSPCWRLEVNQGACGGGASPNQVGLVVDRAGALAPPHTTALVSCAFD